MSRSLGNIIADSLDLGLGYAERLLNGVTEDNFARLGHTGRSAIQSNHPAFIFGHLSLYAPRIVAELDPRLEVAIPATFEAVFSKDATCVDDPDQKIYPAMDEVIATFFNGYRAASGALRDSSDEPFHGPNPNPGKMSELFPTVGSMFNFYCGGHLMLHLGQLSAWRRMKGLGSA